MYMGFITATCKNKICNGGNTQVQVTTFNDKVPDPLPPCSECGFATLDQFAWTTEMQVAMEKTFGDLPADFLPENSSLIKQAIEGNK